MIDQARLDHAVRFVRKDWPWTMKMIASVGLEPYSKTAEVVFKAILQEYNWPTAPIDLTPRVTHSFQFSLEGHVYEQTLTGPVNDLRPVSWRKIK